ncbi:MAG: hypothetical protein JW763_02775 [candidate division Zixibacteria bacterium]|nr:hypothetical protein [candidate division Zixibacteria bacterium]
MKTMLSCLLLTAVLLPLSCSDDSSSPTTPGTPSEEPIAISGSLQAAAAPLGSASGSPAAATAISDYKIIAQALNTKRIYVVSTDANGEFSFSVPAEDTYTFHILDDSYFYVGPVILDEYDADAEEVPEGLETDTADVDLGTVILSEDDYVAVLADGDVVTIDSSMLVSAIAGVPTGAANQGETVSAGTGSSLDLDGDGVINIMDSDDDGDGILDEFDGDHVVESSCTVADFIGLFNGFRNELDADGNFAPTPDDGMYTVTVEVIINEEYYNVVTGVHAYGPAYLDAFAITPEDTTYPDGSENWETYNSKGLLENYFALATGERWGAFLNGTAQGHVWEVIEPGDVWIFEITYELNDLEYTELMAKKINFVFTETPTEVIINDLAWTSQNIYGLPDTVVIRWNILEDLPGMNYGVAYFPVVDDVQYFPEAGTIEAGVDADSLVFVFSDTTLAGETIEAYDIDVVASDSYGDNASTMGGRISKQITR